MLLEPLEKPEDMLVLLEKLVTLVKPELPLLLVDLARRALVLVSLVKILTQVVKPLSNQQNIPTKLIESLIS